MLYLLAIKCTKYELIFDWLVWGSLRKFGIATSIRSRNSSSISHIFVRNAQYASRSSHLNIWFFICFCFPSHSLHLCISLNLEHITEQAIYIHIYNYDLSWILVAMNQYLTGKPNSSKGTSLQIIYIPCQIYIQWHPGVFELFFQGWVNSRPLCCLWWKF